MAKKKKIIKLPELLTSKIYKTGLTRGADDDEIYQNRVGRNSTILIPISQFDKFLEDSVYNLVFENGFIVLISPNQYFEGEYAEYIKIRKLELGRNLLIFYETREGWNQYNPEKYNFSPATSRISPLGGQYVARISATTASENGGKIALGYTTTALKGAGIRAYEYSSSENTNNARLQLEAIFWLCKDSVEVICATGIDVNDAKERKEVILETAVDAGLLDYEKLQMSRIINRNNITICPLCLEEVSANGFFNKMEQAEGREVQDLTITQLNLFHINELRYGLFNHRPYNLGWGHHHCNVVVKDAGIIETIDWMRSIITRNIELGYIKR